MKNKTKQIVLISLAAFAIAGLMLSCSSLNQLGVKPKTEAEKSTAFQLSGLSISPAEVAARDAVVITAEVTDVTSVDGTYNAELKINDVTEASYKVLVPAGKTETLTFVVFKDTQGTYKVALGELTGQFVVAETVAAAPENKTSVVPAQTGASCCGTGAQNSPATQPRPASGGGCCGR
jgi:hypothetical protein